MSINQKNPQLPPLNPWKWPEKPWVRLHADYTGPLIGHMYLIIIDAHSKWLKVLPTSTATAQSTYSEEDKGSICDPWTPT